MKQSIYHTVFFVLIASLSLGCVWQNPNESAQTLPLDDSEYPYAGVPRLVIETADFAQIRDKENKISAKMQIYGKETPQSDVIDLAIKGRGNSSFNMPKFGFKLNLTKKQPLLGMPPSKDWVLVANFRDKTQIKNVISYHLSESLGDDYVARTRFVELYLNRNYMGLYQLTEQVKVEKNRVHIAPGGFLIEKTTNSNEEPHFTSNNGFLFNIKYPPNPSNEETQKIKKIIDQFESFIQSKKWTLAQLEKWIDIEDFVRFYWVQEFSKNLDGKFQRSIYITREQNGRIKMGPVWDFDLAYGIGMVGTTTTPNGWTIRRSSGWYKWLWSNKDFSAYATEYWKKNKQTFFDLLSFIDYTSNTLYPAITNDNYRWPVMNTDENLYHEKAFENYTAAIDDLKNWILQRLYWIDSNL